MLNGALQHPDYKGVNPSVKHAMRAMREVVDENAAAALAALGQIDPELLETDPEFCYYIGVLFVSAGDTDRALSLIEKAVRMGFFCYPWMMRDLLLDPLRTTAEYQNLLAMADAKHRDALATLRQAGGDNVLGLSPTKSSSAA